MGAGSNLFASSLASPTAFPALSQSKSASSQPFSAGFGQPAQTPAATPFGQPPSSSSASPSPPWPAASSASSIASGFGSFGFGQASSSASQGASAGPAASPFGKGLSFGLSSAAAAPTSSSGGFGAFGKPAAPAGFAASQASGISPHVTLNQILNLGSLDPWAVFSSRSYKSSVQTCTCSTTPDAIDQATAYGVSCPCGLDCGYDAHPEYWRITLAVTCLRLLASVAQSGIYHLWTVLTTLL